MLTAARGCHLEPTGGGGQEWPSTPGTGDSKRGA